jgi:hypothetical protein
MATGETRNRLGDVLSILIFACALGFGGWYFYHQNFNVAVTTAATAPTTTPTTTTP